MLKAVFIDYTGTMIEEGGPDAMQMLRRCYKNSDIDSMESMLAYWWKLIKYFEAASSGDSFLTQDEIVDSTLEVCEKEIHLKENFEEIHELCRRFWMYAPAFPDTAEFFEKCSLPIYIITNNGLPYVKESMRDKGLNPVSYSPTITSPTFRGFSMVMNPFPFRSTRWRSTLSRPSFPYAIMVAT